MSSFGNTNHDSNSPNANSNSNASSTPASNPDPTPAHASSPNSNPGSSDSNSHFESPSPSPFNSNSNINPERNSSPPPSNSNPHSNNWYCHECSSSFSEPIRNGGNDLPLCPICMGDVVEERGPGDSDDDNGWFSEPSEGSFRLGAGGGIGLGGTDDQGTQHHVVSANDWFNPPPMYGRQQSVRNRYANPENAYGYGGGGGGAANGQGQTQRPMGGDMNRNGADPMSFMDLMGMFTGAGSSGSSSRRTRDNVSSGGNGAGDGSGEGDGNSGNGTPSGAGSGPRVRTFQWGPIQGAAITTSGGGSGGTFRVGGPSILGFGPDGHVRDPFEDNEADVDRAARGAGPSGTGRVNDPWMFDTGMNGGRGPQAGRGQAVTLEEMLGALMDHLQDPAGGPPPWAMGGMTGNPGDYVYTQEGMDELMEQMMEAAANANGPPPASDVVIEGLPRLTLDQNTLEASNHKNCSICLTPFEIGEKAVRIPCKHIFHEDCLVPWLKQNGTCPECRFSLVPEDETNANRDQGTHGNDQPAGARTNPLGVLYNGIANLFAGARIEDSTDQQVQGSSSSTSTQQHESSPSLNLPGSFHGSDSHRSTTDDPEDPLPVTSSPPTSTLGEGTPTSSRQGRGSWFAERERTPDSSNRDSSPSGAISHPAVQRASSFFNNASGSSPLGQNPGPTSATQGSTSQASGTTETIEPYPTSIPLDIRQQHLRREAEMRARERERNNGGDQPFDNGIHDLD